MKSYLIKWSVSFSDYEFNELTTPSRGDWLVKDGLEYYDEDEEEWCVVDDELSAGFYIESVFYKDEYKLTQVPPEVWARGNWDAELKIESVSTRGLDE